MNHSETLQGYQDGTLTLDIPTNQIKMLIQHDITQRYLHQSELKKLKTYRIVSYILLGLGLLVTLDTVVSGQPIWIGLLLAFSYFPARSAYITTARGYLIYAALNHEAYFEYLKALDVLNFKLKKR